MAGSRAALAVLAVVAAGVVTSSGGAGTDPRTPPALPGMPAPFLGTAMVGSGGLAAAIDAYGAVVDLRAPGPAGVALIENPADRQAAGSVSPRTGIVPLVRIGEGPVRAMWEADSVRQRYLAGTNVVRTVARFPFGFGRAGTVEVEITDAGRGWELARIVRVTVSSGVSATPSLSVNVEASGLAGCSRERRANELALLCPAEHGSTAGREPEPAFERAQELIAAARAEDRRWLSRARPLGPRAPRWAKRMYLRSLLVLRAMTDRHTGAVAAGLRDGWAYVWPRDAGAVALALAASGHKAEARRVARFLTDLDLGAAARFDGTGASVPGRAAQGDATGWVTVAARAASSPRDGHAESAIGVDMRRFSRTRGSAWHDRSDYQEGAPGDYLGNAIAARAARLRETFDGPRGLVRRAGDPGSGLDTAAAWAVRPFPQPALFSAVRETLIRLTDGATPFGITPSEDWSHADPWTAPTAWTAWSLAALGERRHALRLVAALRRASTPAGDLPERVDVRSGTPRSTTPLAWSHAFTILALQQLWP